MNKRTVRLTESELKNIVTESVNRVLREKIDGRKWDRMDSILRGMLKEMEEGFLRNDIEYGLSNMRQVFENAEAKLFHYIGNNLDNKVM